MRPAALPAAAVLLSTLACTCQPNQAVLAEFRAARTAALAEPGPVPDAWRPDVALHLSPQLVDRLVELGISGNGPWTGKIEAAGIVLTPETRLAGLTLQAARGCKDCLTAEVSFHGELGWTAPVLGRGTVPFESTAVVDVRLDTADGPHGWQVTGTPQKVRKVTLDIPGLPKPVVRAAEEPLRAWVEGELAGVEPFTLAEVGREDLPARALRVLPEEAGVRLELLSFATDPGALAGGPPDLRGDWQLEASPASLVALARTEAFRAGPVALDVVPVPETLSVDGDRFELGLRLWRTTAPGWWRDYRVRGTLALDGDALKLAPAGVDEVAQSAGAGRADPLALLGESLILSAISDAVVQTLPASGATTVDGWRARVSATQVTGRDGVLAVDGTLTLTDTR